jgi:hypothetical protein
MTICLCFVFLFPAEKQKTTEPSGQPKSTTPAAQKSTASAVEKEGNIE